MCVWVRGEVCQCSCLSHKALCHFLCVPPPPTSGSNTQRLAKREQRALIKTHVSFQPLHAMSLSPPPHMRDQVTPTAPYTFTVHHSSQQLRRTRLGSIRSCLPHSVVSYVNTHLLAVVTLVSCSSDLIDGRDWCMLKEWAENGKWQLLSSASCEL